MVSIMAFNYHELTDKAKHRASLWLDEIPFDYEDVDEDGNITINYDYFSEWDEETQKEYCEINGYLFDKNGRCIHHLIEG